MRAVPRFTALVLVLNSLFEIGAGALILASPGAVFPAANPHAAAVARTLACAAISAGAISLLMLFAYQPGRLFRALLWGLCGFHVVLSGMHGLNWTRGFTAFSAPFGHLALAVLFAGGAHNAR